MLKSLGQMENAKDIKKLIVLIEDEEIIVNLLSKKLKNLGYKVEAAKDGVNGLALVRKYKPDLVLLDMMLPRLDGFGVLEELSKEKLLPDLPIIIISNSGQSIEIDRALKLGVRDYLIKVNFDLNEVLVKVDQVLGSEDKTQRDRVGSALPSGDILIVEDDLLLVGLLEKKFAQQNYKTHSATDVTRAYKIIENTKIDAILLDIVLPGVDGFTFLEALKSNPKYKDIPVLIVSNLGQKEEIERGLKTGAADYLVKANVSPAEIVKKTEDLIKKII